MLAAPTDALIPLAHGFAIRASVYTWFVSASWRLTFEALPNGRLSIGPTSALTSDDDHFIREHRDELLAAVRYCDKLAARPC